MDDLTRPALQLLIARFRAAVEMAFTLRRDGTPVATALQQMELRVRNAELPAGLSEATTGAAEDERRMVLDLVRRARVEPGTACAGQDPIEWLAMVLEDRARQLGA